MKKQVATPKEKRGLAAREVKASQTNKKSAKLKVSLENTVKEELSIDKQPAPIDLSLPSLNLEYTMQEEKLESSSLVSPLEYSAQAPLNLVPSYFDFSNKANWQFVDYSVSSESLSNHSDIFNDDECSMCSDDSEDYVEKALDDWQMLSYSLTDEEDITTNKFTSLELLKELEIGDSLCTHFEDKNEFSRPVLFSKFSNDQALELNNHTKPAIISQELCSLIAQRVLKSFSY